jgi:hypothetical protein
LWNRAQSFAASSARSAKANVCVMYIRPSAKTMACVRIAFSPVPGAAQLISTVRFGNLPREPFSSLRSVPCLLCKAASRARSNRPSSVGAIASRNPGG